MFQKSYILGENKFCRNIFVTFKYDDTETENLDILKIKN